MSRTAYQSTQAIITRATELGLASAPVIAHRLARMALAGPSPSDRDVIEFQRMSTEKIAAFQESWQAMLIQTMRASQTLSFSLGRACWAPWLGAGPSASGLFAQWQNATLGVLSRGMAPVHRKAVANAKRLATTKLR